MSATAVHFSIADTRACILLREIISDETSREPSLKRFVIIEMCSAFDFLFDFIHAWPRNSLSDEKPFQITPDRQRHRNLTPSLTRFGC